MAPNALVEEILADFETLRALQTDTSPDFIAEVATLYCSEGDRILGELTRLLENPTVDFKAVDAFVNQLKGGSLSVGAKTVENACVQLRELCKQENKEGFLAAMGTAKTEFNEVRNKFQTLSQELERDAKAK